MPAPPRAAIAALPALAAGLLAAQGAARADSEQAASLSLGWATYSAIAPATPPMEPAAVSPSIGGSVAVAYERMIGSDLGLRGELVGGAFYGGSGKPGAPQAAHALVADLGVTLRFDVLTYVPYAFAGVGALTAGGGPIARTTDAVLVVGGGLDWLRSRARSYGVELRIASFGSDVTIATLGLRATARWGFF